MAKVLIGHAKEQMGHLLFGHGAGAAAVYPAGLSGPPDYYINAATGDDGNDGSQAAPWASLSKIEGSILVNGSTVRVLVASGTYSKASDFVSVDTVGKTTAALEVGFEPGCIIDGTSYPANTNGLQVLGVAGAYTNSMKFFGNGLVVRNVTTTTGNAIGGENGGMCYYYDIVCEDSVDGASFHGDQRGEFHRCDISGMSKAAFAHISTTQTAHYKCTFTGASGATIGIGSIGSTAVSSFEDCAFIPASSGQGMDIRNSTLTRCQVGTTAARVNVTSAQLATLAKCFINIGHDANNFFTMDKCFGKYSVRVRNGGAITATNCVFSGPASGLANVIYSNFNPGSSSKIILSDSIIAGAFTFMNVDATNAGYLVSAASEFFNNILYPSLIYDADLITADTGGTVIVGTITDNPLIGPADTLLMADYAFGAGSPAIGAASDAGDIGFGSSEVEERQVS